jgi:hypothetical protein
MGLKDKLGAARRWMWSPMTIDMLEAGSDPLVHAGATANVVLDVVGEDDGTGERIEVLLALNVQTKWPLGELPATVGRHELEVEIPVGIPPSSKYTEYVFKGVLHRSKGTGADAVSLVDVVARPEDLFWPDGPRAQGPEIVLDADPVNIGDTLGGRTTPGAKLEIGTLIEKPEQVAGKVDHQQRERFITVVETTAGPDGAFFAPIPAGAPPTLHHDRTTVIWQVRAGEDAWRTFGVLDPECQSSDRNMKAAGIFLDLFT